MKKLLLTLVLALSVLISYAQNTSEQESKRSRLEQEIQLLEKQLKDNSSKSTNALANIKLISQREVARRALIKESDKEIAALSDSLTLCNREIRNIQSRLDTMTLYFNRLVKNAYKNRDARVWYMYLLASENIGQATKRYAYLRDLSGQMNSQATKIKQTKEELEKKQESLKTMMAKAERVRNARKLELDKLVQEETQTKKLVTQLNNQKTKYQKELNTKKKQVEDLDKEIQRIIAAAIKQQNSSSKTSGSASKPIDYTLGKEFQTNKGILPWPANGPVADHFGRHNHPVYKSLVMPFNNGVNVTVAKGTEVKAVFNGEVTRVIVMPGYNKCVLVQHGDYFTFYCKLGTVSVKAGDKINTGQTLGIVDTIDGLTQYHFQLWKGTTPQDPELWLRPRD